MFPASHLLIYNRVPKAGSSTILTILRKIHYSTYRFNYETNRTFNKFGLEIEEELNFMSELFSKSGTKPLGIDRHFYFINTESYGLPREKRPIWINVIRYRKEISYVSSS